MLELVIDKNKNVAVIEDGELVEYRTQPDENIPQPGEIYMGRVTDKLHGNDNACFVKIGENLTGFCSEKNEFRQDEFSLFQVEASPYGSKQARLSRNIRITAPHIVCFMGEGNEVHVSSKITDMKQKNELKAFGKNLISNLDNVSVVILRTMAEREAAEKEAKDINKLFGKMKNAPKNVGRLFRFTPTERILSMYPGFDEAIFENEEEYLKYRNDFRNTRYVPVSENGFSIFDKKNITGALTNLTGRKIFLKSGASIVIDKTEALTVIDVNSDRAAGKDADIASINLEAAGEIMRQLRLRNIGGAVICDMIGTTEENREEMIKLTEELAVKDKQKVTVHGFTKLGLLEISRKRT